MANGVFWPLSDLNEENRKKSINKVLSITGVKKNIWLAEGTRTCSNLVASHFIGARLQLRHEQTPTDIIEQVFSFPEKELVQGESPSVEH